MKNKLKRTTSMLCALTVAAVPMTMSAFTASATEITNTVSDYTLTIPSSFTVTNAGWNEIEGGVKASGTLADGKKLVVTAQSDNGWALKSGDNSIGYNLAKEDADYNANAEAPTWEFDTLTAEGVSQTAGLIVDNYDEAPAGNYSDNVVFTAGVEDIPVTVRTVTFNTDTDGQTINKDGVTCSRSFDKYNNLFGDLSGFSVSSGQFTKIEVTAQDTYMTGTDQMTMNTIEGWSTTYNTATWTGKSSFVPFGAIMGNENPVTIVFTIEE